MKPGSFSEPSVVPSQAGGQNSPTFSVGPGWPAQLLRPAGHVDLNLTSTQEKPGLSKGVPGRPSPGPCANRVAFGGPWLVHCAQGCFETPRLNGEAYKISPMAGSSGPAESVGLWVPPQGEARSAAVPPDSRFTGP